MSLRLEVARYRGLAPVQPRAASLDSGICTLGRNPDNDLTLEDPERLVSGHHARIEIRGQGFWLIDHSTNGTFLNQSADRLPADEPVELRDGDTLSIGPYDIAVAIDQAASASDPFDLAQEALPGIERPGPAPDIMDLLGGHGGEPAGGNGASIDDPFADARPLDSLLTGPASQDEEPRAAEPRQTPVEHVFFRAPESQRIPEDYDLLRDALLTPTPQVSAHEPTPPPSRGGAETPAPAELEPPPDAIAGIPPSATPAPPPAPFEAEDLQEDQGLARPAHPGPTPQAPSRAGQGPLSGDLLTAFLSGLGAGEPSQVQDPDVFLREAGALLRALTTGLTATMMARAQFKSELRLGVTTIRRTENNPFKFSVSPEEALERLLLRPNPAYLPPLEAARGAFEDIQAHEMAMIAGLRAALRALLARFEPSALEARLDAASGLDRLLPMTRKSRYWDLFTETYGQVAADAAEDFMQLFGEAFTHAYEDQVLRLAQARGRRPT